MIPEGIFAPGCWEERDTLEGWTGTYQEPRSALWGPGAVVVICAVAGLVLQEPLVLPLLVFATWLSLVAAFNRYTVFVGSGSVEFRCGPIPWLRRGRRFAASEVLRAVRSSTRGETITSAPGPTKRTSPLHSVALEVTGRGTVDLFEPGVFSGGSSSLSQVEWIAQRVTAALEARRAKAT